MGSAPAELDVTVVALEALGPETVLISRLPGGKEIATRMGRGFQARVGSTQRLHVDMNAMHAFDPDGGRAIAMLRA